MSRKVAGGTLKHRLSLYIVQSLKLIFFHPENISPVEHIAQWPTYIVQHLITWLLPCDLLLLDVRPYFSWPTIIRDGPGYREGITTLTRAAERIGASLFRQVCCVRDGRDNVFSN